MVITYNLFISSTINLNSNASDPSCVAIINSSFGKLSSHGVLFICIISICLFEWIAFASLMMTVVGTQRLLLRQSEFKGVIIITDFIKVMQGIVFYTSIINFCFRIQKYTKALYLQDYSEPGKVVE